MATERSGKLADECVARSPASTSDYWRRAPMITLRPSQMQSGDPTLGPIECHACGKRFYLLTFVASIERLNRRRGFCPFDECEALFTIEVDEPPPSRHVPKKKFLIPKRR